MSNWIDIASIFISLFSGAATVLPPLLQKHPGLTGRAQELYAESLRRWSSNKAIRKQWETKIPTVTDFVMQLNEAQEPELNSLLNIWVDKLRGDSVCSAFIHDAAVFKIKEEIIASIKAPYNNLYEASKSLRAYYSDIIPGYHIERQETQVLYDWLSKTSNDDETQDKRIAVLLASAGVGKTVILHDLLIRLEEEGIPVLGIKADITFKRSDIDIDSALNLGAPAERVIKEIALDQKVVVLIDQVDALSAVLSADRSPLSSITTFINEITRIPNVRVIVSCRQYDFNYETAFARYKTCEKINLSELTEDNVTDALKTANISTEHLSVLVKDFLKTPLYLFLYCRLADRSRVNETPTLQELYGSLWKETIIDKAANNTIEIVNCLDKVSDEMRKRQVLTINEAILPTEQAHQVQYLVSNNILNKVETDSLQFIHQTLFEYTTARLFVERGRKLNDLIVGKHQGLFIRPQLKQILDYQRGVDPFSYASNVRDILFAKDDEGNDRYRFQLKQLVITTMAYYPSFLVQEKNIIRQLLSDPQQKSILLPAISNSDGLDILQEYINENGGLKSVGKEYLESYLNAVCDVGFKDPEKALAYLNKISAAADDPELRSLFVGALDSIPIGEKTSDMLWDLIKKYGTKNGDIEVSSLLEKLIKHNPIAVGDYLLGLLKDYVKVKSDWSIDVPTNYHDIVRELQRKAPNEFLYFALKMLDIILESSEKFNGDDIRSSTILYMFGRNQYQLHFDGWLLSQIISIVEDNVEKNVPGIDKLLKELSEANNAAKHIIAISGWLKDISRYKDDTYIYLNTTLGKKFHASYLEYLQLRLFEATLPNLTENEQSILIKKIDTIEPEWEKIYLKGEGKSPNTRIGYTKAQYYSLVPKDILAKYKKEHQDYKRLRRKYKEIEIHEPNRIQTMVGWPSESQSTISKMSEKDLIRLARKHNKDNYLDWDKSTRHGNAIAYSENAVIQPDKMYSLYDKMLDTDPSLNYFVAIGIQGLRKAKYDDTKMDALIDKLISKLPEDVNTIDPNISFGIIRDADYYIKNGIIPSPTNFDFMCRTALNAEEKDDSAREMIDINDGINQLRGSAVDSLVQLYYCKDYQQRLFEVLEVVAGNGSVATRCALLFQMALLLNVSREKTLHLFLKAVSQDYNPNLLRMQLHNLNPLVYLAKTNFVDLKDYFEECIACPISHETNVVILFVSWVRNAHGAEDLTLRMADSSNEAKQSLIHYICNSYEKSFHNEAKTVLLRYLEIDDKNVGTSYDNVANILKEWPHSEINEFMKIYASSAVGRYSSTDMNAFLKVESRKHPEDCLTWLNALYNNQKNIANSHRLGDFTQILIEAYNSICKYDNLNPVLEKAMDMFDDMLRMNVSSYYLRKYLSDVS